MKIGDKVEIDGRSGTIATAPYDRSGMVLVTFDDVSSFFGSWVIVDRSLLTSYKYYCKECGWAGNRLEKYACITYADEWYICPGCSRDASDSIAHNKPDSADVKSNAADR